ncbi:MAG: carboxylating nicotinate-nucleotide diphosphorylase [Coriobacteriia bacterium]|nr:carboxylating nicotinate-nucleotide diphosphorylase [Coriobacteriia bacterium]
MSRGEFALPDTRALVAAALAEDLGVEPVMLAPRAGGEALLARDVTGSLLPPGSVFAGIVRARAGGVVAGLPVAQHVWAMLAAAAGPDVVDVFPVVAEGTRVASGDAVLEVSGSARVVLAGERTALDLLMVLSGIATETRRWREIAGASLAVCDTRKTLPGLRALSKYAVRVGGGTNHRAGLFDMVLIKDNHIRAAGGITPAVARSRDLHADMLIEVEADSIGQAVEAARAGADMVLLDNMDDATLARAVAAVRDATPAGRVCLTEASGSMTSGRLPALVAAGIDRVSASALTFAPPLDFGLDERA